MKTVLDKLLQDKDNLKEYNKGYSEGYANKGNLVKPPVTMFDVGKIIGYADLLEENSKKLARMVKELRQFKLHTIKL